LFSNDEIIIRERWTSYCFIITYL